MLMGYFTFSGLFKMIKAFISSVFLVTVISGFVFIFAKAIEFSPYLGIAVFLFPIVFTGIYMSEKGNTK
jgi:hypothetical protein